MKGHEIFEQMLRPLHRFMEVNSITERSIEGIKEELDSIRFFSSFIYKEPIKTIQRVTINRRLPDNKNERITNVDFLKNPPDIAVKRYGRLNGPGQSVLYATFDPITALSEMRPDIGDMITISTWEAKDDFALTVSPVFKNTTQDGIVHNELSLRISILYRKFLKEHDEQVAKQIDMLIQFMADAFAKKVNDNNDLDYYISAYYANKILHEFEHGEIDAIIYPSVRQSLTLSNIAIKPDVFNAHYSLGRAEESIVRGTPASAGGWTMDGTGTSTQSDNGILIWN